MKLLLLAALWAAGAQAAGYRVAGVVENAVTRQPVGGVRVTIAPVEHPDERLPFVTGSDGRFVFAGIPQGRYELLAERRGFLTLNFAQRGSFASALAAGPGQHTDALVLAIAPPGVIAGKVSDDAGEPVDGALVQLFGSAIVDGRRRVFAVSTKHTGDTGEYRFGGLAAGTYFVSASGYPWYTKLNETHGDGAAHSLTHTGYGIQYHRNAGDPAAAEPVILKAGQEANADFGLIPMPAVSVRVHAEDADGVNKQFTLRATGLAGNQVTVRQGSETGELYNFWGVPPGHYTLEVEAADASQSLYAREPIDVGAADTDVSVTLAPAPSLTGKIEVEGGSALPASLRAVLIDEDDGSSQTSPVGGDGRFTVAGIPAQHYRVALTGAEPYYLKRWSADGAGAVRLRVVAAKGAGRIAGTVERGGNPFPGALVVLVPTAEPAHAEDYRAIQTDSDGGYEFRGVAPGAYVLFAVEDGSDLEYANPAAIQPYLGSAEKIKLSPGGALTERLELPSTAGRPASAAPGS